MAAKTDKMISIVDRRRLRPLGLARSISVMVDSGGLGDVGTPGRTRIGLTLCGFVLKTADTLVFRDE